MIYIKKNKTRVNDYSTAPENIVIFLTIKVDLLLSFFLSETRDKRHKSMLQVKIPACVEYNFFIRDFSTS